MENTFFMYVPVHECRNHHCSRMYDNCDMHVYACACTCVGDGGDCGDVSIKTINVDDDILN